MEKNWIKKDKKYKLGIKFMAFEGLLPISISFTVFTVVLTVFNKTFNESIIWTLFIIASVISMLRMFNYSMGYTLGQVGGSATSRMIRLFLGERFRKMPIGNFSSFRIGDIINSVTTDTINYEGILTHKVGDIIKTAITTVLSIVSFILINPHLGITCLVLMLIMGLICLKALKAASIEGGKKQEIVNENISDIVEYISGIQTIRAYGLAGKKNKRLNKTLKANRDINYSFELKLIPLAVLSSLLVEMCIPISFIWGGFMWTSEVITTSNYVISVLLSFFITIVSAPLFEEIVSMKAFLISKDSLDKMANEDIEEESRKVFNPKSFEVELKDVNFSYTDKEQVLFNVSMTAKQGKLTAIVGDSGSGKSTVLNLISKYYNKSSGEIKIGDIEISNINSNEVLKEISTVYQDVFLFNDTILNNIKFADLKASDKEVIDASKQANCHDFISNFKDGYNTLSGEGGDRLSGGEKQRISIARAIIRNAPLLLLDEATNSLDIENEILVKEAIKNLINNNKTVIMIAHKLSGIRDADNIVVMSKGRVVEEGKHDELLKNKSKYYLMWNAEKKISLIS